MQVFQSIFLWAEHLYLFLCHPFPRRAEQFGGFSNLTADITKGVVSTSRSFRRGCFLLGKSRSQLICEQEERKETKVFVSVYEGPGVSSRCPTKPLEFQLFYVFPPPHMMPRVLSKFMLENTELIFVAPY